MATLKNPTLSSLVFPVSGGGTRTLVPTSVNTSYTFRSSNSITFTAGVASKTLPGTSVFAYGNGALNSLQQASVIVIPQTTANVGNSSTFAGTVSTTAGQANITGTSTKFTTQYQVSDYMFIGNTVNRIVSIANDTFAVAAQTIPYSFTANTHNKTYPAGIPINFPNRYANLVISASNTMAITLISANGTTENTAFTASIVYDVLAPANSATTKTVNQNLVVAIDTAKYANLLGTVTTLTTSANVTGTNTYFSATVQPGYTLYTGNTSQPTLLGTVSSVTNNTLLTLTSNSATNLTTNTVLYSAPNPVGNTGPWSLGFPDVYNLKSVLKFSQNTSWTSANSTSDVTSEFVINPNQTDTTYNLSTLSKQPGSYLTVTNGDKLLVTFDAFTIANPNTSNYYTIDSYPRDDANTANTTAIQTVNIPWYKNESGGYLNLRDVVDFRVYVSNTISSSSNVASASANNKINPSNNNVVPTGATWVSPVNRFGYDVSYYLPRIDKVTVNPYGQFNVIEGVATEIPQPPADQDSTMTIGTITIPPYPSLLPSQNANTRYPLSVMSFSAIQPRRYTMKDIGTLATRVQNLEYYTSLSLLEVQTKNLTIKNTATGLDRFKNGIFVDTFKDTSSANPNDPEYNIGNDLNEGSIIPVFHQYNSVLKYDYSKNGSANTTAHNKTGDLVTLPFASVPYLSQINATRVRNASTGFYDWIGKAQSVPAYDNYIDNRIPGTVTICLPYICTPATAGPSVKCCTGTVVTKKTVTVVTPPVLCLGKTSICVPNKVVCAPQPVVVPPLVYGGGGGSTIICTPAPSYGTITSGNIIGCWYPNSGYNLNMPLVNIPIIACPAPVHNVSACFGIQVQNPDGTWGPTYCNVTVVTTPISPPPIQCIVPGSSGINPCNICLIQLPNVTWCTTPAVAPCTSHGSGCNIGITCGIGLGCSGGFGAGCTCGIGGAGNGFTTWNCGLADTKYF